MTEQGSAVTGTKRPQRPLCRATHVSGQTAEKLRRSTNAGQGRVEPSGYGRNPLEGEVSSPVGAAPKRAPASHTGSLRRKRLGCWWRVRRAGAARCKTRSVQRPTLRTVRLELIPLTDDHLEFEVELDSDPEVLRYLDGRALIRAEVQQAHQRRLRAGDKIPGLGFWVGFHTGRFVGVWMLQPPHGPDQREVPGEADLGYRLMRRFWRQGLTSEGARELLRYGFVELGLRRIFGQTLSVNEPSRAVMASIGMTYVRAFSSASPEPLVTGSDRGEVEYEITRDQWTDQSRSL